MVSTVWWAFTPTTTGSYPSDPSILDIVQFFDASSDPRRGGHPVAGVDLR